MADSDRYTIAPCRCRHTGISSSQYERKELDHLRIVSRETLSKAAKRETVQQNHNIQYIKKKKLQIVVFMVQCRKGDLRISKKEPLSEVSKESRSSYE